MTITNASIRGMNFYVFNEKSGRYELFTGTLIGKTSPQIAEENGVTMIRARQYALEKKLPYLGKSANCAKVYTYIFDAAAEEAFRNRKVKRGPKAVPKPPKVPGKIGRPRKEKPAVVPVKKPKKKPVDGPKRGRGRPRKNKEQ